MNKTDRIAAVRAMELLARAINDEEIFETWLTLGVADGDIDGHETEEDLECYIDDEDFADLMDTFLFIMKKAYKSGGLYFDGIRSKPSDIYN